MLNIDQLKHDYHLIIRKELIKHLRSCEVRSNIDYDTINMGFRTEKIYRSVTTEWLDNSHSHERIIMIEGNILFLSEIHLLMPMYTLYNLKLEVLEELIKDTIEETYKSFLSFNIKQITHI